MIISYIVYSFITSWIFRLFLHFGFYEYYCHEHFMHKFLGEHKFSILLAIYLVELLDLTVCAQSLQSCQTLCDPMDCSLLGSSVHVILQARILEWVAMPSFRRPSQPRDQTLISCVS